MINREELNKYKKTIGIGVVLVILIGITIMYLNKENKNSLGVNKNNLFVEEGEPKEKLISNEETKEKKKILVDIKGEVEKPGVYELEEGSIIEDLIKEAGGLTKDGTLENINRAKALNGNEAIVIANKKQLENKEAFNNIDTNINLDQSGSGNKENGKVSINNGSIEELKKLNGIGEGKASAIIEYREKNGGFKKIEDIQKVSGIGKATFEKIKDQISL